jgi:hypothetical protein
MTSPLDAPADVAMGAGASKAMSRAEVGTARAPRAALAEPEVRRGRGRRFRAGVLASITLCCAIAGVVVLNVLGTRYAVRMDATSTGDQLLSPRTRLVLDQLKGPYRIVVVADMAAADPRARQRLEGVLREMSRACLTFSSTRIDTASSRGLESYQKLLGELVQRDAKVLKDHGDAVETARTASSGLATYLVDAVSPALGGIEQAVPGLDETAQKLRQSVQQSGARARTLARSLNESSGRAADALRRQLGEIPLPATDTAAKELIAAMTPAIAWMTRTADDMEAYAKQRASDGPSAEQARDLVAPLRARRDQAAVALDALTRLGRPDILRIADVLEKGQAAIVIGPPEVGIAAIELSKVLPPSPEASTGDQSRRVEEVIGTALATLHRPDRPILVIVHAEPRPFIENVGIFTALSERLRSRGTDVVEWACLVDPDPPGLAVLNPDGQRPVVYGCLSPDSSTTSRVEGEPTGAERAQRLGQVLGKLVGEGKPLLISINPSLLPTYGQPDPTVAVLERFGLAAESGRPLLRDAVTPRGRVVETEFLVLPSQGEHPIQIGVRGLATLIPWPVTLYERPMTDKARATVTPLLTIPPGEATWIESQWLRLWRTPREQRSTIPDLPVFDEGRDGRWPDGKPGSTKPWIIAAAAERAEVGKPEQRLVAVGSNSWNIDAITQRGQSVDGRLVPANPGNLELMEASVLWLAGEDDLIAQSPEAVSVPVVGAIDEREGQAVRLGLIVGMPLLVLGFGVLHRLVRG